LNQALTIDQGKTVLASQVVEECEKAENAKTLFLYCVQEDHTKNTFIAILKSLLSQVLHHFSEELLAYCHERLKGSGEPVLQSQKQASNLLESCILRSVQMQRVVEQQLIPTRLYIVLDGLDECAVSEWQPLLDFFNKMIKALGVERSKLRILFISQHTSPLEKALANVPQIKITEADNRDDIETYVKCRTDCIQERFGLNDQESKKLVRDTVGGSGGEKT
jgi:hypothetical protein